MRPSSDVVSYRIDAHDRLVAVSTNWDEWGAQNQGESVQASRILRQSLWAAISGSTVRELYWHLCERVRTGASARFRFRCDSPFERRVFEMHVTPSDDGGIAFDSHVISVTPTPHQPLLDSRHPRNDAFITMCSWCHGVKLSHGWTPLEEALDRLHLETSAQLPRLTHGVCGPCSDRFFAAIKSTAPHQV